MTRAARWMATRASLLALCALSFSSCRDKTASAPDRSGLPEFPSADASVRIRGSVRWREGAALPRSRPIPIPLEGVAEIANPKWQVDGKTRGVPHAFVEVLGVEERWRFAPPTEAQKLAQRDHRYVPYSFFLRTGQVLEVRNLEDVLHNLKWTGRKNGNANGNLAKGESRTLRFAHAEVIEFRCDVQNWMEAWAYVREHPFGVITGGDGSFELPALPPGSYELRVSHPNPSWKGEARRVQLRAGADTALTLKLEAAE